MKEGIGVFGPLGQRLGLQLHYVDLRAMSALATRLAPLGVTPARATAVIYIALHDHQQAETRCGPNSPSSYSQSATMSPLVDQIALTAHQSQSATRDHRLAMSRCAP